MEKRGSLPENLNYERHPIVNGKDLALDESGFYILGAKTGVKSQKFPDKNQIVFKLEMKDGQHKAMFLSENDQRLAIADQANQSANGIGPLMIKLIDIGTGNDYMAIVDYTEPEQKTKSKAK